MVADRWPEFAGSKDKVMEEIERNIKAGIKAGDYVEITYKDGNSVKTQLSQIVFEGDYQEKAPHLKTRGNPEGIVCIKDIREIRKAESPQAD